MKTLILLFTFLFVVPLWANYEQYDNYDDIVEKLSAYNKADLRENVAYRSQVRSYSRAHAGIGMGQTFFDADAQGFNSSMQNQSGILLSLGVDLLNEKWGVEGVFTNFGRADTEGTKLRLKEYAIKGLYKPSLSKSWNMKLGLGLSSRFLDVANSQINQSYRTPAGMLSIGIDSYLTSFLSIGAEMNYKTALIDDTIDKNSVDLNLRVDTHF
ncbi:MAG: outer membrane beta-barrel protein [Bdellovibrionales bacterium]|nr:outer membrane beta-barrel protein [Bdellovibrionales bacterium]